MADKKVKDVWAFVDRRNENLFEFGMRSLGMARRLADQFEMNTAAVMIGAEETDDGHCLTFESAANACVAHGADRVLILAHEEFAQARADVYARAISDLVRERAPRLFLFPLSDLGRDLVSRTSRLLDRGLIADAKDFRLCDDDTLCLVCPSWGGDVEADIYFSDQDVTGFVTVSPQWPEVSDRAGDPGEIERIEVAEIEIPECLWLVNSERIPTAQRKLEDAETIVAGGAGMVTAEGFGLCRSLAAALGGEVAATRPAVLSHWVSEDRLIGQTGKSVSPGLFISVGASGAVQFTAGFSGAGTVVAINRDPEAPIFEVADIGVVADAGSFLPAFIPLVRKTMMRGLADLLGEECEAGEEEKPSFGDKVKRLRKAHGLSVEKLAEMTGKDPEFVSEVESDQASPSVSFLLRLARALEVDPSTFLTSSERDAIRERRTEQFATRTQHYSYLTLTPGAENEHLRAFMISIEPKQAHKPAAYKHEGEEFVFVMEGELELTLGGKVHYLKKGESKHFDSETPHKLKSLSDEETRCLVVLYTP